MEDLCPLCKGVKVTIATIDGEEVAIPCECVKKQALEVKLTRAYDLAHLPKGAIRTYSLDQYEKLPIKPDLKEANKPAIEFFRQLISQPDFYYKNLQKRIIWIWGEEPNACHTTLAVIIGKAFIATELYRVRFISFQSLLSLFTNFDSLHSTLETFKEYDIYIIDDGFDLSRCMLHEKSSKFILSYLFSFFNDCMHENKLLIITSNCSVNNIDKIFSETQIIVRRSAVEYHIQGSITRYLERL